MIPRRKSQDALGTQRELALRTPPRPSPGPSPRPSPHSSPSIAPRAVPRKRAPPPRLAPRMAALRCGEGSFGRVALLLLLAFSAFTLFLNQQVLRRVDSLAESSPTAFDGAAGTNGPGHPGADSATELGARGTGGSHRGSGLATGSGHAERELFEARSEGEAADAEAHSSRHELGARSQQELRSAREQRGLHHRSRGHSAPNVEGYLSAHEADAKGSLEFDSGGSGSKLSGGGEGKRRGTRYPPGFLTSLHQGTQLSLEAHGGPRNTTTAVALRSTSRERPLHNYWGSYKRGLGTRAAGTQLRGAVSAGEAAAVDMAECARRTARLGPFEYAASSSEHAFVLLAHTCSMVTVAAVAAEMLRLLGTGVDVVLLLSGAASADWCRKKNSAKLSGRFAAVHALELPVTRCVEAQEEGFWKLHLWRLTQYKAVVYLDSDLVIVESIDQLFERIHMKGFNRSAVTAAPDVYDAEHFNAGLLLLHPDIKMFHALVNASREFVRTVDSPDDQLFLNAFYSGWYTSGAPHRLPFRFNAMLHYPMAYLPPPWLLTCGHMGTCQSSIGNGTITSTGLDGALKLGLVGSASNGLSTALDGLHQGSSVQGGLGGSSNYASSCPDTELSACGTTLNSSPVRRSRASRCAAPAQHGPSCAEAHVGPLAVVHFANPWFKPWTFLPNRTKASEAAGSELGDSGSRQAASDPGAGEGELGDADAGFLEPSSWTVAPGCSAWCRAWLLLYRHLSESRWAVTPTPVHFTVIHGAPADIREGNATHWGQLREGNPLERLDGKATAGANRGWGWTELVRGVARAMCLHPDAVAPPPLPGMLQQSREAHSSALFTYAAASLYRKPSVNITGTPSQRSHHKENTRLPPMGRPGRPVLETSVLTDNPSHQSSGRRLLGLEDDAGRRQRLSVTHAPSPAPPVLVSPVKTNRPSNLRTSLPDRIFATVAVTYKELAHAAVLATSLRRHHCIRNFSAPSAGNSRCQQPFSIPASALPAGSKLEAPLDQGQEGQRGGLPRECHWLTLFALPSVLSSVPARRSLRTLIELFTEICEIEPLPMPPRTLPSQAPRELHVLRLWEETGLSAIAYLHPLSLVVADCSALIQATVPQGAPRPTHPLAAAPSPLPPDKFNTRTMVVFPSSDTFEDMMHTIARLHLPIPLGISELQLFLNKYYSTWFEDGVSARLPLQFAVDVMMKPWSILILKKRSVLSFNPCYPPFSSLTQWRGKPRYSMALRWRRIFCDLPADLRSFHVHTACFFSRRGGRGGRS